MSVINELSDRKNTLIYGFLKKLDIVKIDKEDRKTIRDDFLNVINQLYRDAIFIIALKDGIIIQSTEILAKQLLPNDSSVEKLIKRTKENLAKSSKRARRVDEIIEDAGNSKV